MKLFPYQQEGAEWLASKKLALLADEMGLGKSAQAIKACDLIGAEKIFVACPAVARSTWANEFKKFSEKERKFKIITSREALLSNHDDSNIICSYDLLAICDDYVCSVFDTLILDEAHFLKSVDAKRTHSIFGKNGIVRKARKSIWALTGTPAPNHVGELWLLLYSFGVTKLKQQEFLERYCDVVHTNYGPKVVGNKKENIEELKSMVKKVTKRRKIDEVLPQLPQILYGEVPVLPGEVEFKLTRDFFQKVHCDGEEDLMNQIKSEMRYLDDTLERVGLGAELMKVLEAMAKSVSTVRKYVGLQKVKPIVDIVKYELDNDYYKKIVIFAYHTCVIEQLRWQLKDYNPIVIYGQTPANKVEKYVEFFQTKPHYKVFLGQIKAAGTNLTLTASNQVMFAELDWTPGNNVQAAMRCRRIGQTKPVYVRTVTIDGSFDQHIGRVVQRKMREISEIFG